VVARTTCSIERKAALGAMFLRAGWWAGGRLAVFHCTLSVLLVENAAAAAPCIFAFFSRSAGSAADRGRPAEARSRKGAVLIERAANAAPRVMAVRRPPSVAHSMQRSIARTQLSTTARRDSGEGPAVVGASA
jgi:hypothetical protein